MDLVFLFNVCGNVGPEVGLKVYVEGPYSAPSSTVETCQHAVLVATG